MTGSKRHHKTTQAVGQVHLQIVTILLQIAVTTHPPGDRPACTEVGPDVRTWQVSAEAHSLQACLACREMYERFYEAFAQMGEPNIPIDKELMQSAEFYALLDRLRQHAEEHQRDHW